MNKAALWIHVALAAVLLTSSLAKIADLSAFADSILAFGLVNQTSAFAIAYYLPSLEFILAAALFIRPLQSTAAWHMHILFAFFMGLLIFAAVTGLDIHCGCFGQGLTYSLGIGIGIDAALLTASCIALWIRYQEAKSLRLLAIASAILVPVLVAMSAFVIKTAQ